MTIPQWTLLGFATWTLLLLVANVGVYRWGMILLRGRPVGSVRSDQLASLVSVSVTLAGSCRTTSM